MTTIHYPTLMTLGNMSVLVEEVDFVQGYHRGYENYVQYHRNDEAIEAALFMALVRNGWNETTSAMWQTGYILGWLAAFYGQEEGHLQLSADRHEMSENQSQ